MLAGAALATEAAAARRPAAAKVLTAIIIFTPEVDLYWKPMRQRHFAITQASTAVVVKSSACQSGAT